MVSSIPTPCKMSHACFLVGFSTILQMVNVNCLFIHNNKCILRDPCYANIDHVERVRALVGSGAARFSQRLHKHSLLRLLGTPTWEIPGTSRHLGPGDTSTISWFRVRDNIFSFSPCKPFPFSFSFKKEI
jgi:hypothetical protein